jgi:hypothetical protein
MIYVNSSFLIGNAQIYFAREILPNLPNDDKIWTEEFAQWLSSQGARIVPAPDCIRNSIGLAHHYDLIAFDSTEDATAFRLKWA